MKEGDTITSYHVELAYVFGGDDAHGLPIQIARLKVYKDGLLLQYMHGTSLNVELMGLRSELDRAFDRVQSDIVERQQPRILPDEPEATKTPEEPTPPGITDDDVPF